MTRLFEPRDPDWEARTRGIFAEAPFVRLLGFGLVSLAPGRVETKLAIAQQHLQQNGYVHAGVQATLADHTAGAAAATLIPADRMVLSIEFKISLLSPGIGERLICRAEVLKPGRTVSFVDSRIYAVAGAEERLISHATVSIALVPVERR